MSRGDLALRLLTPRIVWAAMLMSTLLYLFVLQFIQLPDSALQAPVLMALVAFALSAGVISILLPEIMLKKALLGASFPVQDAVSAPHEDLYRGEADSRRVFADPDDTLYRSIPYFVVPFIISIAAAEAVAVIGFLLVMLGMPLKQALPLWAISWCLIGIRFPRESVLRRALEKAYDAKMPKQ